MRNLISFLLLLVLSACSHAPPATPSQAAPAANTFRGKLQTGVMAIGGETTGITLLTDEGETLELSFKKPGEARAYRGKRVEVIGTPTPLLSPERGRRTVLQVSEIKALP